MLITKNKAQQGFSLITAIFLLVVVAGLGALMMTFFTAQQQSSALDALGVRANQASRAGTEWGAFQITHGGAFVAACQMGAASGSPGTLSGFAVNVSCNASSHVEGGGTLWTYAISSVAATEGVSPGQPDYVERAVRTTVWQ